MSRGGKAHQTQICTKHNTSIQKWDGSNRCATHKEMQRTIYNTQPVNNNTQTDIKGKMCVQHTSVNNSTQSAMVRPLDQLNVHLKHFRFSPVSHTSLVSCTYGTKHVPVECTMNINNALEWHLVVGSYLHISPFHALSFLSSLNVCQFVLLMHCDKLYLSVPFTTR